MGVADCHGIEMFKEYNTNEIILYRMRAAANRQRFAVAFKVILNEDDAISIISICKNKQNKIALIALKPLVTTSNFAVDDIILWNMIPNDKLDPYWKE